jgi:hypothetical protein
LVLRSFYRDKKVVGVFVRFFVRRFTEQSGYQFKNTALQPAGNVRKTPLYV